jgi:hypothetical protein
VDFDFKHRNKIKIGGQECPPYTNLSDVPLSLWFFLRNTLGKLQVNRSRGYRSILHHHSKSLRAAFTEPEVLNPVADRVVAVRSDRARLDVEDPAFVQVVKTSQTCRIRTLGEHAGNLLIKVMGCSPTASL